LPLRIVIIYKLEPDKPFPCWTGTPAKFLLLLSSAAHECPQHSFVVQMLPPSAAPQAAAGR
jgi:hypothetical protein